MIKKITAALLLLLVLSSQAFADRCITTPCFTHSPYQYDLANQDISKERAAQIARREVPGRVLSVTRNGENYRVKILRKSGEVVIVFVNANTGKVN